MEVSSGSWFETPRTLSDDPSVVTDLEVRTTRRGRILSKAASTQRAHAGTKGAFFAENRREKRDWQGRALPLSYSRATAPHGITDQFASALRASAASSGGTGLMKKPLPHSNPATLVSFGMTSRCQWNDSSSPPRRGAVWSMKLNGGPRGTRVTPPRESLRRPAGACR